MVFCESSPPSPVPAARSYDWRSLLLVLALAFVGAASFQGSRGLYESTEGRYAETARETMLSGDYDDPILNSQPHWTKPPLTYMAIIPGIRLLGENPWGVRAYLVVAMVLAAGAVWLAAFSIWGAGAGRWAGIIFATSPFVAVAAHSVSTDMLLALWTALAFAAFWHGHARRRCLSLLFMWVFLALGLLTKGPPALLVPAASLPVAWYHLRRTGGWRPGRWMLGLGLAIFLVLGFSWYFSEAKQNPGLASYWLGTEIVARNLTNEMHRNSGLWIALVMYVPILLLGTGPWLLLALWRARPIQIEWQNSTATDWNRAASYSLLSGVVVPFLVFSLSRSKLALYLIPLFIPLSILGGQFIQRLVEQGRLSLRAVRWCAGGLLALIIAAKAAAGFIETTPDMTRLAKHLAPLLNPNDDRILCSVSSQVLNGLEFHLRRPVEAVTPLVLWEHMKIAVLTGQPTDYLVKVSRWGRLAPQAPAAVHVEPLGRCWVLVTPDPAAWKAKYTP